MLEMKVTIAPTTELVTVLDKLAAAIGGGSKCRETVPEAPKAPGRAGNAASGSPGTCSDRHALCQPRGINDTDRSTAVYG